MNPDLRAAMTKMHFHALKPRKDTPRAAAKQWVTSWDVLCRPLILILLPLYTPWTWYVKVKPGRLWTFKVAFLSRIHMVIRSGHTEEKQSCPHAERAENVPRFCQDASRRSEETHREMLPVCLYIFRALQLHWQSAAVCYVNIMPDLKSQSQVLWLVVAALASIFTVVFIPRIQSAAALSPVCYYAVPQCSHKCCHFSIQCTLKPRAWALLIRFQMKSLLSYLSACTEACKFCLDVFSEVDVSVPWPIFTVRHGSLQQHPDENLPSTFFQPFVRRWWEYVVVISRRFEPSADGGQRCALCRLSRWVEMNNSTMSVWVPSASEDLIVSECRVHLAWPRLAVSACL